MLAFRASRWQPGVRCFAIFRLTGQPASGGDEELALLAGVKPAVSGGRATLKGEGANIVFGGYIRAYNIR
jgi:hypothetical protein